MYTPDTEMNYIAFIFKPMYIVSIHDIHDIHHTHIPGCC